MDDLLNNAPCGFLVFSDDGKIVETNATLLAMLGYEPDDLRGLHIEKLFSVEGGIFYRTNFLPALKLDGKAEGIYLDLRSKEAAYIPVLINAARRGSGAAIFNDCIFIALRPRCHYEAEILRAKKAAEAAAVAKNDFLSVISHELRTPLNAILGWTRILQNSRQNFEILDKGLDTILRSTQAQTQIVDGIMDFSRIDSGRLQIECEPVDLTSVVESAIDAIAQAANAKDVRLEKTLESNCAVFGDAARLQQVFRHILTNAVKFTPKGGRAQILMRRAYSSVEITVSDTGEGIDAAFLPFVFNRFQQTDKLKTRRGGGLGLGLIISRHLIELHGGTIRAESAGENLGAAFTVCLPEMIVGAG